MEENADSVPRWTCRANGSTWEVYQYAKGEPIVLIVSFWTFDDQYLGLPQHERFQAAYRDAKAEVDRRNAEADG